MGVDPPAGGGGPAARPPHLQLPRPATTVEEVDIDEAGAFRTPFPEVMPRGGAAAGAEEARDVWEEASVEAARPQRPVSGSSGRNGPPRLPATLPELGSAAEVADGEVGEIEARPGSPSGAGEAAPGLRSRRAASPHSPEGGAEFSSSSRSSSSADAGDVAPWAGLPSALCAPRLSVPQTLWARVVDLLLISRLAGVLYGHVAHGWLWLAAFLRLVLYSIILLPGFLQMIAFYFFSPRLTRSVVYGPNPRNRLDVYLPRARWRKLGPRPVVVFVTGGAWVIGYKAWGALLARRLSQRGVLVACLDYRNFPQGLVADMLEDVNCGIAWCLEHCAAYGGDPESVFLVGQSAGGHLSGLACLAQAAREAEERAALAARLGVCVDGGAMPRGDAGPRATRLFSASPPPLSAELSVPLLGNLRRGDAGKGAAHAPDSAGPDDGLDPDRGRAGSGDPESPGSSGPAPGGLADGRIDGQGVRRSPPGVETRPPADVPGPDRSEGLPPSSLLIRTAATPAWDPAQISAFVGVSAVYDLVAIEAHMAARGFRTEAFKEVMTVEGAPRLGELSPTEAVGGLSPAALERVPPTMLLHGTADTSVPAWVAEGFSGALRGAGVQAVLRLYRGKTHTQPIVEDPMRGGRDELMDDVLALVTGLPQHNRQAPMLPSFLIDLATFVCPF